MRKNERIAARAPLRHARQFSRTHGSSTRAREFAEGERLAGFAARSWKPLLVPNVRCNGIMEATDVRIIVCPKKTQGGREGNAAVRVKRRAHPKDIARNETAIATYLVNGSPS
jgi:hypothetical protein